MACRTSIRIAGIPAISLLWAMENGMTFGFLAARLLLDWFQGIQSADYRLFAFGRHR
jgi:hypothetical protein